MPLVDRRYAEALLEIAAKRGHEGIGTLKDEFRFLMDTLAASPELGELIRNQTITRNIKKDIFNKIFESRIEKDLLNFLLLLVDKNRDALLPGIFKEFTLLCEKRFSVLNIRVYTAIELEKHQIADIEEKFLRMYGSFSAKTEVILDPSLIGGVKVRIGDTEFDSTIKGRLKHMMETVLNG